MRFLPLLLLVSATATSWSADLEPDPAVTWGTLDNGLRYALMRNEQPQDKVSIRLQVRCGSLEETEPQRGLAHFLEHLAFNGTTHYPPGTLVERLQHLGLAFGAHTNAHTSFQETVYKLELPDAKPETIAIGLEVMADWGGGMLLEPAEVDRERGVIIAELRDRDGAGLRQARALYGALYAGTVLADRLPIGHGETIQAATRELIAGYYDAWYRPERMVLAVVGAIEPAAVEAQVRDKLGTVAGRGTAGPEPELGELTPTTAVATLIHTDPESDDTSIQLMRAMPAERPVDSLDHRRDELVRALAEGVLARRIRALVEKDPACPLQAGGGFSYHWVEFAHAGAHGTAKPGRALDAVRLLSREYRRMAEFGPTVQELAVECGAMQAQLDTAVAQAGVRSNPQLAQALYTSVFTGETFLSPAQERDLLAPLLPTIQPADIVASIAAYRARPGRDVVAVTGREDLGAGGDRLLAAACAEAAAEVLERPVEKVLAPWGYPTDFAKQQATGFWQMDPENDLGVVGQTRGGLRIQTKFTIFQPNQILIQLRFHTGVIPRAAGIAEIIERGFLAGGLGKHSADDEATLFADSSVRLGGITVGEDAVTLSATCTPADYQRALERLAAHVADPGWRPEAEARIKQAWDEELAAAEKDVAAQTERTLQALLVADDPARRQATRGEAAAVGFAAAKAWLAPILSTAPLTVTVVGDAAEAKGYPDVVFQADGRSSFPPAADEAGTRKTLALNPAPPVGTNRVKVQAQVAKALVRITWPGDDIYDIRQTRRLNLLAQCLSERLRMRIREELGAAYSPGAWNTSSEAYRGAGGIQVSIGVTPEQVDQVVAATLDLADRLAADGIDAALLDQVKTPLVKGLAARKQRNDWWAGVVLPRLATQPFRLEWARGIETDFAAVTADELSGLATKFLVRSRALTVIGVAGP